MSLSFITELNGAMDPLLVVLYSIVFFLHGITMFKYIKVVKISENLSKIVDFLV
jgi:hypothetical protein